MRIGVLGAGRTGANIGTVLSYIGHEAIFSFTLLRSNTNQTVALRHDSVKPILEEAAEGLAMWISRAELASGPSCGVCAAATRAAGRLRPPPPGHRA